MAHALHSLPVHPITQEPLTPRTQLHSKDPAQAVYRLRVQCHGPEVQQGCCRQCMKQLPLLLEKQLARLPLEEQAAPLQPLAKKQLPLLPLTTLTPPRHHLCLHLDLGSATPSALPFCVGVRY